MGGCLLVDVTMSAGCGQRQPATPLAAEKQPPHDALCPGPDLFHSNEGICLSARPERCILTWSVPANFADNEVDVILTVGDATGQENFPTFKIVIK
jgi:hypothetical protein